MGARLAREAAKSFDALVAGAVGPLGVRIEPLGKIALAEARSAFREQIQALNEEGVDLIILETFGYLEELHQALLAAREVNPDLPVVAQVTIDEDGNCLDGSSPEHYGPQLQEWGADVVGCNCSVGPVAMLDAMERVRAVTTARFQRSRTPACRARWTAATSICARRSTWPATPRSSSRWEFRWSAAVAEPRLSTFTA